MGGVNRWTWIGRGGCECFVVYTNSGMSEQRRASMLLLPRARQAGDDLTCSSIHPTLASSYPTFVQQQLCHHRLSKSTSSKTHKSWATIFHVSLPSTPTPLPQKTLTPPKMPPTRNRTPPSLPKLLPKTNTSLAPSSPPNSKSYARNTKKKANTSLSKQNSTSPGASSNPPHAPNNKKACAC